MRDFHLFVSISPILIVIIINRKFIISTLNPLLISFSITDYNKAMTSYADDDDYTDPVKYERKEGNIMAKEIMFLMVFIFFVEIFYTNNVF